MKRITALLLVFLLLGGMAVPSATAVHKTVEPVILVPGYGTSPLLLNPGTEEETQIWMPDFMHLISVALSGLGDGIAAAGDLAAGKEDRMVRYAGNLILEATRNLNCNPDGSDVAPIAVMNTSVEESTYAYLMAHNTGGEITEQTLADMLVEEVGADNLFYCFMDFRKGAKENAELLRHYVEQVKAYTGAQKVRMVAVSYGGEIIGAYLNKYGTAGDLSNVVLTVPALGGAAFAYDALSGDVHLDEELIANFVEYGEVTETQLHWLLRADKLTVLDPLCSRLAVEYARQAILYWNSMWDLIPPQYYEELKSRLLNPVESARLIENSDYIHNEVMPRYAEIFAGVQQAGGRVYLVAGTGHTSVTGLYENADGILRTKDTTGAVCAPMDERFADGYVCRGTRCSDPAHDHLSPSREIDASCAYLPEQTWFVQDMFHGMGPKDPAVLDLIRWLTFSASPVDVHTDARYPQFEGSRNPTDTVYITGSRSGYGYLTKDDTSLRVTNVSRKYPLQLLSVTTDKGVKFRTAGVKVLQPGETAELAMSGTLPDTDNAGICITVDYVQIGGVIPVYSKTFGFTIRGGRQSAPSTETVASVPTYTYDSVWMQMLDAVFARLHLQDLLRILYTAVRERFAAPLGIH